MAVCSLAAAWPAVPGALQGRHRLPQLRLLLAQQPGDRLQATTPSGLKVKLSVPEGAVTGKKCFYSGDDATHMALFARAF